MLRSVLILLVVGIVSALAALLTSAWQQGQSSQATAQQLSGTALLDQWAQELTDPASYNTIPVPLAHIKGLSPSFTPARGKAVIDLNTGEISVRVQGLDSLPAESHYQVWLVDHQEGERNSIALDFGEFGDHCINLGILTADGSLTTSLAPADLAKLEIDMVAVVRITPDRAPQFVIGGMQSIVYKTLRQAQQRRDRGGSFQLVARAEAANDLQHMIRDGKKLFEREQFSGNGRTCATCHRARTSFIIDADFIQKLTATELARIKKSKKEKTPQDALFVAGIFDPSDGTVKFANPDLLPGLFEDPPRMFNFGHILENQDGTDEVCGFPATDDGDDQTACLDPADVVCDQTACEHPNSLSVRRNTPTVINTLLTAPFGLGGDVPDLQAFSAGAVFQHFPKTLNREASVDFRTPTQKELEELEAFQRAVLLPNKVEDPEFDPFALAKTKAEQRGADLFRAGVFGSPPIGDNAGRCSGCHSSAVLGGGGNFDTGVNALPFSQELPFDDGGANSGGFCISDFVLGPGSCDGGSFNTLALVGIADTAPFFHNGAVEDLRGSVEFYTTDAFTNSTAGQFIANVPGGGPIVLDDQAIDDIVTFMEAISKGRSGNTK
ncbi:MAG: hypothetical protein ACE5Q6_21650 [Dehalococcoidia bacterium]